MANLQNAKMSIKMVRHLDGILSVYSKSKHVGMIYPPNFYHDDFEVIKSFDENANINSFTSEEKAIEFLSAQPSER